MPFLSEFRWSTTLEIENRRNIKIIYHLDIDEENKAHVRTIFTHEEQGQSYCDLISAKGKKRLVLSTFKW